MSQADECFILVKAQPHRSSKYSETVCCAGIGRDGKWRRQYPVPFRILDPAQKFGRWQWISYRFTTTEKDRRIESQKVLPESIVLGKEVPKRERSSFLNPLIRPSLSEADDRDESLALIRPDSFDFSWKRKTDAEIYDERIKHAELANQLSLLDHTARPLEPCPFEFKVHWKDGAGIRRNHICDDWETAQALRNFSRRYGESEALKLLHDKYQDYYKRGLALAFSTHSRRNKIYGTKNQWLLVGLIRLDHSPQGDFLLD